MFRKINKSENFTPGFVCVLHTFGRSLQWNPHIHVLISEGGAGNISPWRSVKHFNYTFLRSSFQMVLLNLCVRLALRVCFSTTISFSGYAPVASVSASSNKARQGESDLTCWQNQVRPLRLCVDRQDLSLQNEIR